MRSIRSVLVISFLVLLAGGGWSTAARAQTAANGKFVLPFDVQWGKWTIPAGEYSFTLDRATAEGILTVQSSERTFKILQKTAFSCGAIGDSTLRVERINGKWTVSELHLTPVGTGFCYCHKPKGPKEKLNARNHEFEATIPVTVSGK
jgi:hypothetical protein